MQKKNTAVASAGSDKSSRKLYRLHYEASSTSWLDDRINKYEIASRSFTIHNPLNRIINKRATSAHQASSSSQLFEPASSCKRSITINPRATCVSGVDEEFVELVRHALSQAAPAGTHFARITDFSLSDDHLERRARDGQSTAIHAHPVITHLTRRERYTYGRRTAV